MAETSRQTPITQQEIDIYGVSLNMLARVGDKTFSAAVSPVDFSVFKKDLYRDALYAALIEKIEEDLLLPKKRSKK